MSCPDWRALAERREAGAGDGAEWRSALSHLDACPACQAAAPAADPILLFQRLPTLEAGRDEVEAMKLAVAGMRRGRTIEHRREPRRTSWARAAALAAVVLGSLLLRGAAITPDGATPVPVTTEAPATAASDLELRRLPLIEAVDPAYGSIIQVVDDDISLVLVVPAEIDV